MLIDRNCRSQWAKVELYGFDLFASQFLTGEQTLETTPQDYKAEQMYVLDLIARDDSFSLC
jgi:hypothetical protein